MAKAPTRVTLPGSLYQKSGRWWWDVNLPGEDKQKARALKPAGSRCATTDRQEAEEVAREMWRLAIEAEAAKAKVRDEAADVIEKAQSECEKKIKKSKRAVARAEEKAKAQSEARLRAEEGYRIQAEQAEEQYASEIAKIRKTIEQAKVELVEKDRAYKEALAEAEQKVRVEVQARQEAESRVQAEAKLRVQAEQRADSEVQARLEAEAKLNEVLEGMRRTGACECCGRNDVPEKDLAKIDSGQRLCSDCLKMLRG